MLCSLILSTTMLMAGVPPEHANDFLKWRVERLQSVSRPYGWLSLVGLHWLEPGENRVGRAASNDVVMNVGPDHLGVIEVGDEGNFFTAAEGVTVTHDGEAVARIRMNTDVEEETTVLQVGAVRFYIIDRGELAIRVKDPAAETRTGFVGLQYFPINPEWRVTARFEPHEPGTTIDVPDVFGNVNASPNPGRLIFEVNGHVHELEAVGEPGDDLFIIFGDKTNGKSTYGAGRFVYAPWPESGTTVVDFNKSYSPPCIFTDYATCPLPPPENRIPDSVDAGEKNYVLAH